VSDFASQSGAEESNRQAADLATRVCHRRWDCQRLLQTKGHREVGKTSGERRPKTCQCRGAAVWRVRELQSRRTMSGLAIPNSPGIRDCITERTYFPCVPLLMSCGEPKHPLEALRHSSGSSWDCIMPVFECPRPSSNWPISWMMTSLSGKYGLLRHRLKISIGRFASRLVMAGIILFAAKELLGHHSSQRYAHLAPSHVKRAVEALACRKQLTPARKSA